MKYPFISKKNPNNENPLKSSFEALNYYTALRASRAKTNHSAEQSFPFPLSQAGQARKTREGIGRKGAKKVGAGGGGGRGGEGKETPAAEPRHFTERRSSANGRQ